MKKITEMIENKNLSARIYKFLDTYANIRADYDAEYDGEDEKYASPDASYMKYCADLISQGIKPDNCWSDWSSGGYKPYTSKAGKSEHDYLLGEIKKIISS